MILSGIIWNYIDYKESMERTSLAVQWLRHYLPMQSAGSVPGQGTKTPNATQPKKQNMKQKHYCKKFNRDFKLVHIKNIRKVWISDYMKFMRSLIYKYKWLLIFFARRCVRHVKALRVPVLTFGTPWLSLSVHSIAI